MNLALFENSHYTPGAPLAVQILWHFFGQPLVESRMLPFSGLKVLVLRSFGADIGHNVRVKPGVRVKFPWRLKVGDFSWIGEDVWIDNLAEVRIGAHCCISQGAYLCTGSHDWKQPSFDLQTKPIYIENHAWVAARCVIAPGIVVAEGAVLALGSVAISDLAPWTIYLGNPAARIGSRPEQKPMFSAEA